MAASVSPFEPEKIAGLAMRHEVSFQASDGMPYVAKRRHHTARHPVGIG